jgi:hypothetical protein
VTWRTWWRSTQRWSASERRGRRPEGVPAWSDPARTVRAWTSTSTARPTHAAARVGRRRRAGHHLAPTTITRQRVGAAREDHEASRCSPAPVPRVHADDDAEPILLLLLCYTYSWEQPGDR